MGSRKRKTLPSNYDELMDAQDLDGLEAMYAICEMNAYTAKGKHTPLFDLRASDEFCRWLVDNGADIDWRSPSYIDSTALQSRASAWLGTVEVLIDLGASLELTDRYGRTALHHAAGNHKVDATRALLRAGADLSVTDNEGRTPLERALSGLAPAKITFAVDVVTELISAGAPVTDACRSGVRRAGGYFEQVRERYNPATLDATEAALHRLYAIVDVEPAPRVIRAAKHDGRSRIVLVEGNWMRQSEDLWERLVPDSGPAPTVQGEVIRIAGRIAHEVLDNGGINWDADFEAMLDALERDLASHDPLDDDELESVLAVTTRIRRRDPADLRVLARAAVEWAGRNSTPIALDTPAYRR